MAKLKPCPFCGADASEEQGITANVGGKPFRYVICTECSAQSDLHDWNTRPATPSTPELKELIERPLALLFLLFLRITGKDAA